jgi:hypothetical protein
MNEFIKLTDKKQPIISNRPESQSLSREKMRIPGAFLISYVVYLFLKREWALPKTNATAVCGGMMSGLFADFFGVGGAVRGAFLSNKL